MDLGLRDKIILLSGSIKGAGESIARLLVAEGARPVFVGKQNAEDEKILTSLNENDERCFLWANDMAAPEQCSETINQIIQTFGSIDGIVNQPAIKKIFALKESSYEIFWQYMQQNLVPYFLLTHYALPALKISKGAIVNLTQLAAPASPQNGHTALTREWAVELLPYNIRVNAVAMAENATDEKTLANTIAFLLSKRASHITGEIIYTGGNIYSKEIPVEV
jgi:L-fucose dehydrogenase